MKLKSGLHIVVRVAEHACDNASKRILKPSTYRLQIFLVRDKYLRSLLPHRNQAIAGQLEKHVLKPMLAILTTYMETRLKCWNIKPGLHKVVRVAERACDDASKRILKPSAYRLQIFLVRDQYLRSSLPHRDQAIAGQLEKHVLKPMLAILTTYMETRLKLIVTVRQFSRFLCAGGMRSSKTRDQL